MILDTNALSAFFEGAPAVVAKMACADRVALPVIVMGEYRFGLRGSRSRKELEKSLDALAKTIEVLPVLESTTTIYADIRRDLKRAGRPIPENDIWIAALAREYRLNILSRNEHFDAIPDIRRLSW